MTEGGYVDTTQPPDTSDRPAEREALRLAACWDLASSLTVMRALLAGRPVAREMLHERYRDRLHFWGGFVDDLIALDVALIREQLFNGTYTAVALDAPPAAPAIPEARSLADYGVLPLDDVKPAKRRRT